MRTVRNANVTGKKVLLRVDYNLPVDKDGQPSDDARIVATVPTIEWLLRHKVDQIIIMTHWGRPKKNDVRWQLKPVTETAGRVFKKKGLTSGRGPTGVAAAAVYIASVLCGERRTQRDVAEVARVTEVTVRNRYKELCEKLGLDVEL